MSAHTSKVLAVLLASFIWTTGCDNQQMTPAMRTVGQAAERMRYFRDDRTGLCFAATAQQNGNTFTSSIQLTWVPCEPKVLELIRQEPGQ